MDRLAITRESSVNPASLIWRRGRKRRGRKRRATRGDAPCFKASASIPRFHGAYAVGTRARSVFSGVVLFGRFRHFCSPPKNGVEMVSFACEW